MATTYYVFRVIEHPSGDGRRAPVFETVTADQAKATTKSDRKDDGHERYLVIYDGDTIVSATKDCPQQALDTCARLQALQTDRKLDLIDKIGDDKPAGVAVKAGG